MKGVQVHVGRALDAPQFLGGGSGGEELLGLAPGGVAVLAARGDEDGGLEPRDGRDGPQCLGGNIQAQGQLPEQERGEQPGGGPQPQEG